MMTRFDDDRFWLERQAGMENWRQGCADLNARLDRCVSEYAAELRLTIPPDRREPYQDRLWSCWSHHWQSALVAEKAESIDGYRVAVTIRAGRGYSGKQNLGGDPLRDLVLAEAVCQGDNDATRRFSEDYRGLAVGVARRFSPQAVPDADDWWHDLLTGHLAAFDRKGGGALAAFHGHCSLAGWLPMVVKRYVLGGVRRRARRREILDSDASDQSGYMPQPDRREPNAEARDCLRLFRDLTNAALATLPPRLQTVLRLVFCEEQAQKEIAAGMGIKPGRLSHIKRETLDRWLTGLHETAAETGRWPDFKHCLRALFQHENIAYFGDVMLRALKGLGQEEER